MPAPPNSGSHQPTRDSDSYLSLAPGAKPVADYTLVEPLGKGGFGEVWRAKGPGGFPVALKIVRLEDKGMAVEIRSLELMREIRHPHLLDLFGAWRRGPYLIIAMALGDKTLLQRLFEATQDGHAGIPADELMEYMREAAKAIDYLNGLGIQHRDIKPHNFLLVGGSVRLADFGLAKVLEQTGNQHSGSLTPAYAAPEFLEGKTAPQSDQYSLAVTYCQLCGGGLPFVGNTAQVVTGHLMHPPDLSMLPKEQRQIVGRALEKQPAKRFASCRAFVEALTATPAPPRKAGAKKKKTPVQVQASTDTAPGQAVAAATARGDRPPKPSPRKRRLWVLGYLLVLMLAMRTLNDNAEVWDRVKALTQRGMPKEIVNSIGMKLVLIPAGKFTMGSPKSETGRGSDEEQHEVEITKPFYMGAYEVTQQEYEQVMGKNPSKFKGNRLPVELVTWDEAKEFCVKLSGRPPEQASSRKYRLPAEAEWEYACRAGAKESVPFHFGRAMSSAWANFDGNLPFGGAPKGKFLDETTPVGSFPPNAFGLYDMHGNVREWCADWYSAIYFHNSPIRDPQGPETGVGRVLRGGSWYFGAPSCRSAYRTSSLVNERSPQAGFRVVCTSAASGR